MCLVPSMCMALHKVQGDRSPPQGKLQSNFWQRRKQRGDCDNSLTFSYMQDIACLNQVATHDLP